MILSTWILFSILHIFSCKLLSIEEKNDFKKALSSHSNILVSFLADDKIDNNIITLLNDVSVKGNKLAKVLSINCKVSKKLCKQLKAKPDPFVLHHFHKGKFNKIYDRKMKLESILKFLEDPLGDISWDEDETAKDINHVRSSQDLQKMVANYKTNIPTMMLMFYAPWCGYCKQMKPEFAAAATMLKGKTIFIGINGDLPSTDDLKQAFNITGYPSIFLVQDGNKVYKYEHENSRDALINFVKNPTKPPPPANVPWSEETNEIDFLTDSNFNDFVNQHESVLVMFYAPWCGHCKTMKPKIIEAAGKLRTLKIEGRIAALDATENKNISDLYKIKGFPTFKYFRNGEYMYDVNERSTEGLVSFMRDPKEPEEPKPDVAWRDEQSAVIHPSSREFRPMLKKIKHVLIMYYAPWCGHCKATKPMFTAAANRMHDNNKVAFVAVDCTEESFNAICSSEGVNGFPTIRYYNYGKNTSYSEYSLEREEDDFVAFMTNPAKPKLDARRHWRQIPGNEAVVVLESENFVQSIVSQKNGALVMFYSPWCGHCVAMKPAFVNAAKQLETSLPSSLLGVVDATQESQLAAKYKVSGFPTLIYFSSNGDWEKYKGGRKENDIIEFMLQKKEDENRKIEEQRKKEEQEKRKKDENEKKQLEEKKRQEEVIKKRQEEEKLKEEKKKLEELRKKQEEERLENERKEKERIKKEEEKKRLEELKKREDEERKIKEEKERKKQEEDRLEKEKIEREEKRKLEELKKREEEERKIKEEEDRKKKEEERLEKERKEREEKEKLKKQEEDRKRDQLERERKEKERLQKEEEKKKLEEIKIKEEKEKERKRKEDERLEKEKENKRKSEELRLKIEEERKERLRMEEERKHSEELKMKEEEIKTKVDTKSIKDEKEVPTDKQSESKKQDPEALHVEKGDTGVESDDNILRKMVDEETFQSYSQSSKLSIFYCHHNNRKSNVRKKLEKILVKSRSKNFVSFDINCSQKVELCDRLGIVEDPVVLFYRKGNQIKSMAGTWSEDELSKLLEHSSRDEL